MQELTGSIKRPNLRIVGIEEEEVQEKGVCNIFNKIFAEFPKFRENHAHTGIGGVLNTKQT
jgi:hypothetical protein